MDVHFQTPRIPETLVAVRTFGPDALVEVSVLDKRWGGGIDGEREVGGVGK